MASLKLQDVYKVYQSGVVAVTDFTLDIEDKEFIVFVGPSGCGKSTTLRMIAGLEEISDGDLFIDGKRMNDVQPKDRDIAMVFQNYALYPHMTVYDNMAFGLKLRKKPKAEIDEKVKEAARILGLEQYLQRKPKALSGGQRQRVALGRAIVREPKVFLLDEPLSNLDAKLRAQMRTEITKLHHRLATTFIYVTHDQVEAMTMGTRIVVMKDGLIQQVDAPQKLYDYPANLFVAGFIGTPQMNFFDAVLTSDEAGNVFVEFEGCKVALPKAKADKIINIEEYLNTEKPVVFGVRPEDFHDEAGFISNSKETVISVKVEVVEKLGAETLLYCVFAKEDAPVEEDDGKVKSLVDGSTQMIAKVDSRSKTERDQVVELAIDIMHSHLFDKETELTILEGEGTKAYVPVVELQRQEERRKYAEEHPEEVGEKPKFFGLFGKKKKAKVETPAEEKPVEETPAEEVPAVDAPVEETPAVDAPVEEPKDAE
ncbi:MAG: sn-glycerol-3-phosphate ABC transporter ATP-binding protein UgpC [Clostridia bacterium]|nr:sn-glycerol-3-phosphate ABC transporter ATP-binding protein UgpC [Clostridia bacterium]